MKYLIGSLLFTLSNFAFAGHGHVDGALRSDSERVGIADSFQGSALEALTIVDAAKTISNSMTGSEFNYRINWEKKVIEFEGLDVDFYTVFEKDRKH